METWMFAVSGILIGHFLYAIPKKDFRATLTILVLCLLISILGVLS